MSRAGNKRGVFNTIGAYTSLSGEPDLPKPIDSFTSINNKNEPIGFLLDVIKTVAGANILESLLGGIITTVVIQSESKLKTVLKKQITKPSANAELPVPLTDNGMNVPIKEIDTNGKLKIPPSSTSGGNLLYGSPSNNNFDYNAYSAISNEGQTINNNNILMKYNSNTDDFNIKPNINGSVIPISGNFFNEYVDNAELLNKNEILANVLDSMYGSISKNNNKTVQEILDELIIEKLLENLLNGNDSFELTDDELDELTKQAEEMANGIINKSMGCGLVSAEMSMDDLNSLIASISGSTDQFKTGKLIGDAINNSVKGVTTPSGSNNTANSDSIIEKNKETIKNGFLERIIRIISTKMLQAVTTAPQILVLFGMVSYIETGGNPVIGGGKENLISFKRIIKCLAKEILTIIGAYLFAIAIQYLIKLLTPIIKKILKEKITQFRNMLLGLFGGSNISNVIDSP